MLLNLSAAFTNVVFVIYLAFLVLSKNISLPLTILSYLDVDDSLFLKAVQNTQFS